MKSWSQKSAAVAFAGLAVISGCAVTEDDSELNAQRQELLDTVNGLKTINGLSTINGLKTINGLSTINGLKTINGLSTINGLKTINGLSTINGLTVDCTGKTAGVDCTGAPDGLLSASTGMMSTDLGIMTAKYLVRCALPATSALRIKDYTGALVTLTGEAGLAPEWETGQCTSDCEEKVSACLMSLTNVAGNHVNVELANQGVLGASHSSAFPYQEAVFYGNVFTSPPSLNFSIGKDYQSAAQSNGLMFIVAPVANRICAPVASVISWGSSNCPYVPVGNANAKSLFSFDPNDPYGLTYNKCSMSNGAASSCKDKNGKTWSNPITTYRMDKGST